MEEDYEEAKVKSLIHSGLNKLDLVFAIDTTGSMGSYISAAKENITKIMETIQSSEKCDVQFAVVAYKDHPPQDCTFITKVYSFTTSVNTAKHYVSELSAGGGGDCPEAVADCLHEVSILPYRKDSVKVCVFVADAPPHGLPDNPSDGLPPGWNTYDPIILACKMARSDIAVYSVGCEPQLGQSPWGREFFKTISEITGGQYIPLANARILPEIIIGSVEEELVMQKLSRDIEAVTLQVQHDFSRYTTAAPISKEHISEEVAARLQQQGVSTSKLIVDNIGVSDKPDELIKLLSRCKTFSHFVEILKKQTPPPPDLSNPSAYIYTVHPPPTTTTPSTTASIISSSDMMDEATIPEHYSLPPAPTTATPAFPLCATTTTSTTTTPSPVWSTPSLPTSMTMGMPMTMGSMGIGLHTTSSGGGIILPAVSYSPTPLSSPFAASGSVTPVSSGATGFSSASSVPGSLSASSASVAAFSGGGGYTMGMGGVDMGHGHTNSSSGNQGNMIQGASNCYSPIDSAQVSRWLNRKGFE